MDFLFRNITNSAADVAVQYRYLATETMQRTSIANSSTLVNTAMPLWNGTSESASQPLSASVRFLSAVIRYSNLYYIPILILVGLFGNVMSFIVFTKTQLRSLTSSVYLATLAIADTGCLLTIFVSWMINVGVNLYHREGWCQTFVYLTYAFGFLSVCYVVSFTVERFIAVCYPLKRQQLCTVKKAWVAVTLEAVFAFSIYSFAIWTSGVQTSRGRPLCYPLRQYYRLVNMFNNIDSVVTLVIPFLIIVIVNISLVYKISFASWGHTSDDQGWGRRARRFSRCSNISRNRQQSVLLSGPGNNRQQQARVTKMLLVVSTVFLILNLPSHAMRLYNFIMLHSGDIYKATKVEMLLQELFSMLYYTHFSVNFFLYSLCGRNFRKALKGLICGCRDKNARSRNGSNSSYSLRRMRTTQKWATSNLNNDNAARVCPQTSYV